MDIPGYTEEGMQNLRRLDKLAKEHRPAVYIGSAHNQFRKISLCSVFGLSQDSPYRKPSHLGYPDRAAVGDGVDQYIGSGQCFLDSLKATPYDLYTCPSSGIRRLPNEFSQSFGPGWGAVGDPQITPLLD
jgi:hypothetical protein